MPGISVEKMMEEGGTGPTKVQIPYPRTTAPKKMKLQIDDPGANHDDLKYRITVQEMAEEELE